MAGSRIEGFEIGFGDAGLEFDQEVVADKNGEATGLGLGRVVGSDGLLLAEEGILEGGFVQSDLSRVIWRLSRDSECFDDTA